MNRELRCFFQIIGTGLIIKGFCSNIPIFLFLGSSITVISEILYLFFKKDKFILGISSLLVAIILPFSYFYLTSNSDDLIHEVLGYESKLFPKTQIALTTLLIYEYILYIFVLYFLWQIVMYFPYLFKLLEEKNSEIIIRVMNVFYPVISIIVVYNLYLSLFDVQITKQVIKNEDSSFLLFKEEKSEISLLKAKVYLLSKYFDLLTFEQNNGRCKNLAQSQEITSLIGRSFTYINESKDEIIIDKNEFYIPKEFYEKFNFFINFGKRDNIFEQYKPNWEIYKCSSI